MKLRIAFSFLVFSIFVSCSYAMPYNVGNYVVDVDVRNSLMLLIPKAKVRCWKSGGEIKVKASASGYISENISIAVSGDHGYFKRDIILRDVEKNLVAEDLSGRPIASAYFQKDQYGFAPNEYGITVFIPQKSWPRPAHKRVDVFDLLWGVPLKNRCAIEKVEGYYKVKMAMARGDLDLTSRTLVVVFNTSKKLSNAQISKWIGKLENAEKNVSRLPPGGVSGLAKFIFYSIPQPEVEAVTSGKIPVSLKKLYDQAGKFSSLHHEQEEVETSHLQ